MIDEERSYDRCSTCGEWSWSDRHKCPPVYEIWDSEYLGDEYGEVHAACAREAAAKYGEQWDQDEPQLHDGGSTTHEVRVRLKGDENWEGWSCWGEATINYYASRVR